MLNRTVLGSLILLGSSSVSFAANGYLGVGLGMNTGTDLTQATLYGGYGGLLGQSKFYLGGELGIEANSYNAVYDYDYGRYYHYRYNYATALVSLRLGYMLTDNLMLYGRLGEDVGLEHNLRPLGLYTVAGVGLENKLSDHWSIRAEYDGIGPFFSQPQFSEGLAKVGLTYSF